MDELTRKEIEGKLGYSFHDQKLLDLAFTHRSYYNENRGLVSAHNERLEFLGDAVLGLLISDYLYQNLPNRAEGELSMLRSRLVESSTCAKLMQKLGLADYVYLGKGERLNEGRGRETILGDLFEALIGAIYLDGGIVETHKVFWDHMEKEVSAILREPVRNWKAELQDYSQKKYQKPPIYKIDQEVGPDHSKIFHVVAYLEEMPIGKGCGNSKKEAEQLAAQDAIRLLKL